LKLAVDWRANRKQCELILGGGLLINQDLQSEPRRFAMSSATIGVQAVSTLRQSWN